MALNGKLAATPKLRFPECLDAPEWKAKQLSVIAENLDNKQVPITGNERTKGAVPYYGASGIVDYVRDYLFDEDLLCVSEDGANLVTRAYPIAFPIAGKTWVNNHAHVLRFDKSTTQKIVEEYLNFADLRAFITGMAQPKLNRAMLDIIPIPMPDSEEQQRIADCLTSLDNCVAAQGRKVEALKTHKRGLIQQLFPREGETLPRLRFPEFRDAGAWEERLLSASIDLVSGVHLSGDQYGSTAGEVPYFTGPSDFTNDIGGVTKWTSTGANTAKEHDTLITVKGSGVGQIWYLTIPSVAMGRQLMAVRPTRCSSRFVYYFLLTKRSRFEDLASGNLIPGLSRGDILNLATSFPSSQEQHRIAYCLSSLDTRSPPKLNSSTH